MTIVINTPNSHIGRRVTQRLLDSEIAVDIITRNPDKVRDLSAQGASVLVGSCDDQELLTRAFEGAEAVFWLTPPAYRPDYKRGYAPPRRKPPQRFMAHASSTLSTCPASALTPGRRRARFLCWETSRLF